MLLRAILCGGVWNGFLLGKAKKEDVPCIFFGMVGCLVSMASGLQTPGLPPLVIWLLFILSGAWVLILLTFVDCWTPPDYWDAEDNALEMTDHPDVWTAGSREDFSSKGGFEVAGVGVYLLASELAFDGLVWGTAEEYGDARLERCRAFLPVPGGMQTVALSFRYIDNVNVARSIGRLLDHGSLNKPLPLVKDGDLIALVQYMIRTRGLETVRVTKIKGDAEDVDVQQGRVRLIDQQGNAEADTAADLGRRHQSVMLIDARRRLLQARSRWYPMLLDLHRFMIAVALVSVNHDGKGGTAPDPLVWDQGSRPKVRKLAVRDNVDLASLPGPPGFLNNNWVQVDAGHITSADISAWPYSIGILVRFTSFLGTLHWPSGSVDLGHFGSSFLELLILFEQWAGHRLLSEKVTRPHVRAGRPISVSSVPVSEGIEIRHGCQFISSLVRALSKLPGGLGRFLPCNLEVNSVRIIGGNIAAWPYSVGILMRFISFLNSLRWPSGAYDFGHFGVSFLERLILFEQWAGHRFLVKSY